MSTSQIVDEMMSQTWRRFPYDTEPYQYDGDALQDHWTRLHEGDREPFPDAAYLTELDTDYGVLDGGSATDIAKHLQQAWRLYHAGEFAAATELGETLGMVGAFVANKANGIHTNYLEDNEKRAMQRYQEIARRAEEAAHGMPEHANSHYFQAFSLGRYSQGISITKALTQGIGGTVRDCLQAALEIEPDHADAHTAMGLYHAEIIDKVGKMIGGLTYGANIDAAREHLTQAVDLAPQSAIARIERANGLLLLDGDGNWDEASDLYVQASEMEPADAMERLDVELAKSELE
jgi:tetratricopeptide (TPR) repeat protein